MDAEPVLAATDVAITAPRPFAAAATPGDYWALAKPDVNLLVTITTAAAFSLAAPPGSFPWALFLHTIVGTLLVASGSAALNQWREHPHDARMRRTARRPIAAGRLDPARALTFGAAVSLAGVVHLALTTNRLASLLALATLVGYVFVYTPSKRLTPLCTLLGAIPGAVPPLIGWAAARGQLDPAAWQLYAILFCWQFPHFMAIAWMYRDDYARAGYLVLPRRAPEWWTVFQTLVPLAGLLAITLLPPVAPDARPLYTTGVFLLGASFLYSGVRFASRRSGPDARRLLKASIVYLPALLAWMTII